MDQGCWQNAFQDEPEKEELIHQGFFDELPGLGIERDFRVRIKPFDGQDFHRNLGLHWQEDGLCSANPPAFFVGKKGLGD